MLDWLRRMFHFPTQEDREESFERTRMTIKAADEVLREHAATAGRSRQAIEAARRAEAIRRERQLRSRL